VLILCYYCGSPILNYYVLSGIGVIIVLVGYCVIIVSMCKYIFIYVSLLF